MVLGRRNLHEHLSRPSFMILSSAKPFMLELMLVISCFEFVYCSQRIRLTLQVL